MDLLVSEIKLLAEPCATGPFCSSGRPPASPQRKRERSAPKCLTKGAAKHSTWMQMLKGCRQPHLLVRMPAAWVIIVLASLTMAFQATWRSFEWSEAGLSDKAPTAAAAIAGVELEPLLPTSQPNLIDLLPIHSSGPTRWPTCPHERNTSLFVWPTTDWPASALASASSEHSSSKDVVAHKLVLVTRLALEEVGTTWSPPWHSSLNPQNIHLQEASDIDHLGAKATWRLQWFSQEPERPASSDGSSFRMFPWELRWQAPSA